MEQFIVVFIVITLLFVPIWTVLKRDKLFRLEKQNLLGELARRYNGKSFGNYVEFEFQNNVFKAFLADPVFTGTSDGGGSVVPGFFAIECLGECKQMQNVPLMIEPHNLPNELSQLKHEIQLILDKGFNEIEIQPHAIQVRKLNLILSKPNWDLLMQNLSTTLPLIIKIRTLI